MEQYENIVGPKYAIRVGDLREWHIIIATCFKCGHNDRLMAGALAWERSPHTKLGDLERKLRCTHCGNRADNTLSVRMMPRN
jgi:hypothetical protein